MITCFFENDKKASGGLRHVTVGVIAINDKREVLLVKRSQKYSRPGKYTVPGGFLDRGETTAQAALRELHEESGYIGEIQALFHINDNPDRPHEDRQNVDFIFLVKVGQGEFVPNDEIENIAWFGKDNLPTDEDFAFDHKTTILKTFEYLEKPFPLPLLGKL